MEREIFEKCRYCGSDIVFREGQDFVRCASCGETLAIAEFLKEQTQTAKAEQENEKTRKKLAELYHQAENMQMDRRFDKAEQLYREVVINGGKDPEVYWRIILCHYCVVYQKDDEGNQILTILYPDLTDPAEMSIRKDLFNSIQNEEQRAYYQNELRKLDNLLNKYREVQHQAAYDVFISVKQTIWKDGKKYYTVDREMGHILYDHLTSLSLRVFNSEEQACKCPPGQEWEPYILSALLSSRIMIVTGSCPEYMESQWVKNEWSRFQWLQKNEGKTGKSERKLLCYISDGMNPYDIPKGLNPDRQAIVNNAIAFKTLDDEIRKTFPWIRSAENAVNEQKQESSGKLEDVLANMEVWLTMGQYDRITEEYTNLVKQGRHLNNSRIHLYAICAEKHVKDPKMLAEEVYGLQNDKRFQLAQRFAKTEEEQKEVEDLLQQRLELDRQLSERQKRKQEEEERKKAEVITKQQQEEERRRQAEEKKQLKAENKEAKKGMAYAKISFVSALWILFLMIIFENGGSLSGGTIGFFAVVLLILTVCHFISIVRHKILNKPASENALISGILHLLSCLAPLLSIIGGALHRYLENCSNRNEPAWPAIMLIIVVVASAAGAVLTILTRKKRNKSASNEFDQTLNP